jgi:hypothetical protein
LGIISNPGNKMRALLDSLHFHPYKIVKLDEKKVEVRYLQWIHFWRIEPINVLKYSSFGFLPSDQNFR